MRVSRLKKRSRLLSLVLVLILAVSMLVPVTAFAYEDDDYSDTAKKYTVVLHANMPNRGFAEDWDDEKHEYKTYKAEKTDTFETSSTYKGFDIPSENITMYPEYKDYDDGYYFSGWSKSASGAVISDSDYDVKTEDLAADSTTHLYAQWKRGYYVITLDAGVNGYIDVNREMKDGAIVTTKYQKTCHIKNINNDSASYRMFYPDENEIPKAHDSAQYVFDGWYYNAALTSPVPESGFSVTGDVTLYAKYISKAEAAATKAAATSYYNKASKAAKKLKVTGTKASAAGKKKANVKWKANKKASGYQIQYSLKKNFKNAKTVTVKGAKKKVRKLKGMKKGKTYYIRVRTYQNILGITNTKVPVYGKWSKKMKVKVK